MFKLNIVSTNNNNGLPMHLGGHENETHIDEGALNYLLNKFNIKSFLDIGCGPGGMVELAYKKNLKSIGIDGDFTLKRERPEFYITHDYTTGPAPLNDEIWDLGWSCEFLEHVEEKYMDNYMDSFLKCKYIIITHALPGQGGHYHVNEQTPNYWFIKFGERGFLFDLKTTNEVRQASTMKERFMRTTGLFFWNGNLNWKV